MNFYDKLADQYDAIFPHRVAKEQFIGQMLQAHSNILDVGSATGAMAIALARQGHTVTAIDLNEKMINMARAKAEDLTLAVNFEVCDMQQLRKNFADNQFDFIFCIGNTLPHLENHDQVSDFLSQAYQLLNSKGKILLQTVNFDKLIEKKTKELPLIEAENFTFRREYEYKTYHINFKAELQDKVSGENFYVQTKLLPLYAKELQTQVQQTGFENIRLFGDFTGAAYGKESPACILLAEAVPEK